MEMLPEKDQKKLMNAMEKLAENPYAGKSSNNLNGYAIT